MLYMHIGMPSFCFTRMKIADIKIHVIKIVLETWLYGLCRTHGPCRNKQIHASCLGVWAVMARSEKTATFCETVGGYIAPDIQLCAVARATEIAEGQGLKATWWGYHATHNNYASRQVAALIIVQIPQKWIKLNYNAPWFNARLKCLLRKKRQKEKTISAC